MTLSSATFSPLLIGSGTPHRWRLSAVLLVVVTLVGSLLPAGPVEAAGPQAADAPVSAAVQGPVVGISAGAAHGCVLLADRTVECWGDNIYGQLGYGGFQDVAIPVPVDGLTDAVWVAAGDGFSCAVTDNGSVSCWGGNLYGQLGNGSSVESAIPVQVTGLDDAVQVVAGAEHACALVDVGLEGGGDGGSVWCWGRNDSGQLGDGTSADRATPLLVGGLGGIVELAAGESHTCALTDGGEVWCWGSNASGQLGNPAGSTQSPPAVVPGLDGVQLIAAGGRHTCAVVTGGALWCWGDNGSGQVDGTGNTEIRTPVPVPGVASVSLVGLGDAHTCARLGGDVVRCWGSNSDGQLGDGTTDDRQPVDSRSISGLDGVVELSGGAKHTCAVLGSGLAWCWGLNSSGQMGDATQDQRLEPVQVLVADRFTVPGVPLGVTASAGDAEATVSWAAPARNGGRLITGYTVTAQPGGQTCATTGALSCVVMGLVNGEAYTFTVVATNQVGDSPRSSPSVVVTPQESDLEPPAPGCDFDDESSIPGFALEGACWLRAQGITVNERYNPVGLVNRAQVAAFLWRLAGEPPSPTSCGFADEGSIPRFALEGACWLREQGITVNRRYNPTGIVNRAQMAAFLYRLAGEPPVGASPAQAMATTATSTPPSQPASCGFRDEDAIPVWARDGACWLNEQGITVNETYNPTGEVNRSQMAAFLFRQSVVVPSAPINVAAVAGSGEADVSWEAPLTDGGSTVGRYEVTAFPGPAGCTALVGAGPLGCTVSGLVNGATYRFTVRAINDVGIGAASVPTEPITPRGPATVPAPPAATAGVAGDTVVTVSWSPPGADGGSAVTGYAVIAQPGGEVCVTAQTSCEVEGLSNGTAYTFAVVAINAVGDSVPSLSSAPVTPRGVPGAPVAVSGVGGDESVLVTWQPPTDDGGSVITGYEVTADPDGATCATAGTSCEITGLENGRPYSFTVVAINEAGPGASSIPSTSVAPVSTPGPPGAVIGVPDDGSVLVTWEAPAATGGSFISEYVVTASPGGATCFASIGLSCTVFGLTNGTPYTFTVVATSLIGAGAPSDPSPPVVPEAPASSPGAPTSVTGIPGDGQALISWDPPTSDGGSPVTQYGVTAEPGGAACVATAATTCVVTGLTNGSGYTFTVVAVNAVGTSPPSQVSASVVPRGVPGAVTEFGAFPTDSQVGMFWGVPDSNGSPITGYTVTASPGGATCTALTPWGCSITGLTNGVGYRFTVVSTNAAGDGPPSEPFGPFIPVSRRSGLAKVAAGLNHTCALVSDAVRCWGDNDTGQLGNGTTTGSLTPVGVQLGNLVFFGSGERERPIELVGGQSHSCALISSASEGFQTVRCWGGNANGQLGDGTTQNRLSARTAGITGAVRLAAGFRHTCALRSDRTVWCWGDNASGQLGDGTTTDRLQPVQVPGLSGVAAITAGADHTCALMDDDTVRCWGGNSSGQLGDGTATRRLGPVTVSIADGVPLRFVASVVAGGSHTCALGITGQVWCWGANFAGQLGDRTVDQRLRPVTAQQAGNPARLAAGSFHTCAVDVDGSAKCWGFNAVGQLGDGTQVNANVPVAVSGLGGVSELALGNVHSCALVSGGAGRCWGANFFGQLGDGTQGNQLLPVAVVGLTSNVPGAPTGVSASAGQTWVRVTWQPPANDGGDPVTRYEVTASPGGGSCTTTGTSCAVTGLEPGRSYSLSVRAGNVVGLGNPSTQVSAVPTATPTAGPVEAASGAGHSCALFPAGVIRCVGSNEFGQLGNDRIEDQTTSVLVMPVPGSARPVGVAAGYHHGCALMSDGTVACWGRNDSGQLGDGTTQNRRAPVVVSGISTATAVTAGADHTCVLLADGSVRCFGANAFGQLGDGSQQGRTTPVAVTGVGTATQLSAGDGVTCARLADGVVRCWGANGFGQLGDGSTQNRSTAVTVGGLGPASSVAVGAGHVCAVVADGEVRCWGANFFGQLGDGTGTAKLQPSAVVGLNGVVAVEAGFGFTCAVGAGGELQCWGRNAEGQLGDGSTTQRLVPTPVDVPGTALDLAVGPGHACAPFADGLVRCWGANALGQLGDGSTTSRSVAVVPNGFRALVQLAAGGEHTCALLADGTVWCWGDGRRGQLGGGSAGEPSVPVRVSGLNGAVALAAGTAHTCALTDEGLVRCWGDNRQGQLGDLTTTQRNAPASVSGLVGVAAITAGGDHTCALSSDGLVNCWGRNDLGQLGDGTTTSRTGPTTVVTNGSAGVRLSAVAAGDSHTCGIDRDSPDRVWCWGYFAGLDVPPFDVTVARTITRPVGATSLTDIASGFSHSCVVTAAGLVECFGRNRFFELGTDFGSTSQTSVVNGVTEARSLALGTYFSCATMSDGSARCWGENRQRQLGAGLTTPSSSVPVAVTEQGVSGLGQLAAGNAHVCALPERNVVRCWGENARGQAAPSGDTSLRRLTGVAPGAPVNVTAEPGIREVRVSWTPPSVTGSSALTGYTVTADPGGRSCSTSGATSCTVTGLSNGATHTFTVVATNDAGESPPSAPSAAVTTHRAPGVPVNVQVENGASQLRISWEAPPSGGTPITGYLVTAWPEFGEDRRSCGTSGATACTISIQPGVRYTVTVTAINAVAEGAFARPPGKYGVPAPVRPGVRFVTAGNRQVDVVASYTTSQGLPLTGVTVTASPGGRTCVASGQLDDDFTTRCTVTGLDPATTYTFTAVATNAGGSSPSSDRSRSVTTWGFPAVPQSVVVAERDGGARVTWRAPASNGGAPVTGYNVAVTPGNAPCTPTGPTSCSISGLANGTRYTVEVSATTEVGTGSGVSSTVTPARPLRIVDLDTRLDHTCALVEGGKVGCWGVNTEGNLGDGTQSIDRASITEVRGITNAIQVVAGDQFSCALLADGTARCWGLDAGRRLGTAAGLASGDGRIVNYRAEPGPPVQDLSGAIQLAAGSAHACALTGSGIVACWGDQQSGAGGFGNAAGSPWLNTPRGLPTVTGIAAGLVHTCGVGDDGRVSCWGANDQGQLGDGTLVGTGPLSFKSDFVMVSGIANATQVVAGDEHSCALLATGQVWCWGANGQGQLGDGTTTRRLTPVQVSGLSGVKSLTAGKEHTCAVFSGGGVRCWGANAFGQLGDGTTTRRTTPVPVVGADNVTSVAAGARHTCARRADGTARCWGNNAGGRLGNDTTTSSNVPVDVVGFGATTSTAVAVTSGFDHTCALRPDGTVQCWGSNDSNQLGVISVTTRTTPVTVANLSEVVQVSAGNGFTCALLASGAVRCWGSNRLGQLGDNAMGNRARVLDPDVAVSGITSATHIAAGGNHACARLADGTVRCWGGNNLGQVGNGSTTTRLIAPVTVTGLATVTEVAAGSEHSCALLANGTARCWGSGLFGRLGDNSGDFRLTPVAVRNLTGIKSISAGGTHSCAVRSNGTGWCWGRNSAGQLGDATATNRTTPVAVASLTGAVEISAGGTHSCARRSDASVRCWGDNNAGQLGDGTTNRRQSPVTVAGGTVSQSVSGGGAATCSVLPGGGVRCWGQNSRGQLGDGTTNIRLQPVAVTGFG